MSRIRRMTRRQWLLVGGAGVLVGVGVLLIILWQLGVFDSAPPPASLQSAVESVLADEEQEQVQAQAPAQVQEQAEQSADADGQAEQPQVVEQQAAAPQPQAQAAEPQQDQPEPQAAEQAQASTETATEASTQDYSTGDSDQDAAQESAPDSTQDRAQDAAQETQQQATTASPPQQDEEEAESTAGGSELAALAGSWQLSGRGNSFVGYRIGEELAGIGTVTAVGRTSDIEAALQFDGAAITAVAITADLRTLRSDESFRDRALRTRGIESDIYPFATFTLTEPIAIDALPVGEETIDVSVSGTLELHGVTNAVQIALQGQYVDGLVVVVGSTEIVLADYDIEKPTSFRVLSIEDAGIMEFQLVLERAE